MDPKIVDPTDFPGWDDLILATPGYSFFHSSAWARILAESYGYTPLYFAVLENGKLRALVPLMEVNSIFTGKRVVSLPFTDYCEPIIDESVKFQDLFDHIIGYGKKCSWKYIELRFKQHLLPHAGILGTYLGHTLDLTKGEEKIFSNLRDSTRRNIKKAMAKGVDIKVCKDPGSIEDFYRLNCMTRREHGLPPQPYHFFQKVYDHVISKGHGFVILASHNAQVIAGAVFFISERRRFSSMGPQIKNTKISGLII